MDQNENQKLQTVDNYSNHHLLIKKTLQFLIPISVFSFLLSYSSSLSLSHHSIHFYFRKFIFPLFNHTVDRKYMFLICNALLAFLARNLGFRTSSQVGSDLGEDEYGGISASELSESKASVVGKEEALLAEKQHEEEEKGSLNIEVLDDSGALLIGEEEEEDLQRGEESRSLITAEAASKEEEQQEEGNEEFSSIEELNKKFEEFIRRMKEEIRIEARRQVIKV